MNTTAMDELIGQARGLIAELNAAITDYERDEAAARRMETGESVTVATLGGELLANLRTAVAERAEVERRVAELVAQARAGGSSWSAIGAAVGTSGEAARQRYSKH